MGTEGDYKVIIDIENGKSFTLVECLGYDDFKREDSFIVYITRAKETNFQDNLQSNNNKKDYILLLKDHRVSQRECFIRFYIKRKKIVKIILIKDDPTHEIRINKFLLDENERELKFNRYGSTTINIKVGETYLNLILRSCINER